MLRRSIAVSPSLVPAWGSRAAPAYPRDPKSDGFSCGAGKNNILVAAVLRGGRLPSLASLVANGCFLTHVRYSVLDHNTPFLGRTLSRMFRSFRFNFDSYYSIPIIYVFLALRRTLMHFSFVSISCLSYIIKRNNTYFILRSIM